MEFGPPRDPKSSTKIPPTIRPEIARILDLAEERNRRREERKAERRKHGKRQFYAHMAFREWRRKFDAEHMLDILARLSNQMPDDDPFRFKTGGVGLTIREHRVMVSVISWHMSRKETGLDSATISRRIGLDKSDLSKVLRTLGEAGLIVNLAGNSAPNLAPNPDLGFWDLRKLPDLRKMRSGRNPPPWSR